MKLLPISVVFRRIDLIAGTFRPATNVQITGSEPALRDRQELIAICRRHTEHDLRGRPTVNMITVNRCQTATWLLLSMMSAPECTTGGNRQKADMGALRSADGDKTEMGRTQVLVSFVRKLPVR
jgi:hypothetical protein